jgi:tryptophan-rich sensory protein
MMNRFFQFFLKQFDDADYIVRQKAHSLFYLSLGFLAADTAYLLFFLAQKRYDSGIIITILLFFIFLVMLLFYFRKGRSCSSPIFCL